jgi:dTDP-4-dehydrorhamnose 3,5-epimerase
MEVFETTIPEVILFKPRVFEDSRGSFFESYNRNTIASIGISDVFVQDNQSQSTKGVLRGLHYQTGEHAQSKLVRVLEGAVYDVAVDIRKGSPHYGKYFGAILSAENKKQMYIPRGFAHGFIVLSDTSVFAYKCDNFYTKESEGGIVWNDPFIHIDWQMDVDSILLSEKDELLPRIEHCRNDFIYSI